MLYVTQTSGAPWRKVSVPEGSSPAGGDLGWPGWQAAIQRCTLSQVQVTQVMEVCTEPELSQFRPAGSYNSRQPLAHPNSPHLLHGVGNRTGEWGQGEEILYIWMYKTSDAQCSYSAHWPMSRQFPSSSRPWPGFFPSLGYLYTEHDVIWHGISPWSMCQLSQLCPFTTSCSPQLGGVV